MTEPTIVSSAATLLADKISACGWVMILASLLGIFALSLVILSAFCFTGWGSP